LEATGSKLERGSKLARGRVVHWPIVTRLEG